jgi:hypothetical protein
MVIYDVVQTVDVDALTSVPSGRTLIEFHAWANVSRKRAEVMQGCASVPEIHFAVEAHDELCPGRASYLRDRDSATESPCTCQDDLPPPVQDRRGGNRRPATR